MKLLRVGASGAETPAIRMEDGSLRDLSEHVTDIDASTLSPAGLARLGAINLASCRLIDPATRIGACIARPMNFVCIGLNYADHAAEAGMALPTEPIVFLKALSAFCGPFDDVPVPPGAEKVDWEVELGVVIGTLARRVTEEAAMDHVAGYCVVNDVSERAYQSERGGTWDKGKGCDNFGPTGPWLVTKDEVPDPQALDLWCDVDGQRMQHGNTRTMIFGVRDLVSYVSHFITLHAGDIIATGTPPGVGLGKKPQPVFLRTGQVVQAGVQGLGEQSFRLVG